ncbi:MAG: hypothetical protein ACI32N_00495 [Bulleidia sp.]
METEKRRKKMEKTTIQNMIQTIFRAVGLAMGIGVTVLTIMKTISTETAVLMPGIGLACMGIALFDQK